MRFASGLDGTGSRLAAAYLLLGWLAVVALAMVMPPFQNPDEATQLLRADQVSRLVLRGERLGPRGAGGQADPAIIAAAAVFVALPGRVEAKVSRAMLNEAGRARWSQARVAAEFSNTAVYPPFLYAPAAVAIALGKAGGLSVVDTLQCARIFAGVTGVAVGAWAIALAGTAAPFLFVLLALPSVLAQLASPSQDALLIPLAALGAVLLAGTGRRFAAAAVCFGLIAMARPPYAPLLLLLLLPGGVALRTRVLALALTVLAMLGWLGFVQPLAVVFRPDVAAGAINPGEQLLGLAVPPWRFAVVMAESLRLWGVHYGVQVIGQLGWLDVRLPPALHVVAYGVLVLCLAPLLAAQWRRGLLVAGGMLAATLAVFLAQYLVWTPVGAGSVEGVQGRYLLPIIAMAGILGRPVWRAGGWTMLRVGTVLLFPVAAVGIMLREIVARYYL